MAVLREEFSGQAAPEVLAGIREIAQQEGQDFQSVLEDALRSYIERKTQEKVRPEVMAHYRASVERHRKLYELLAQ